MPLAAILSLCLTVGMFIFSLLFKVAGKLRLTIPVVYFLILGFFPPANKWAGENETLAFIILYTLLGLTLLSWIASLAKTIRRRREEKFFEEDVAWQIRRARELGNPVSGIIIDEDGTVRDSKTGKSIIE